MKLKIRTFAIAGLLSGIVLTSCNKDFLNEQFKSGYSASNTYVDSLGIEAGIAGLYALAREQYGSMNTNYSFGFGLIPSMNCGTDLAMKGNAYSTQVPYSNYTLLTSQDPISLGVWQWGYAMINNANLLISGLGNPSIKISENYRNKATAEARFFRAYTYNYLTTLYGAVPLIEEPLSTPKTNFVRTSEDTVLHLAVQDLLFASQNLPPITQVSNEGRLCKAAAEQELAIVYLKLKQPDSAAIMCQNIINSGNFQLVTQRYGVNKSLPGDYFSDMFITGNMDYQQGNSEAIWTIQEAFNIPGGTSNIDVFRRAWVPYYANHQGMLICDSLGGRGLGRIRPTNWATYDLYGPGDIRNSAYNFRRNYYYNDPTSPNYGQLVTATGSDTLTEIFATTTKWNSYYAQDPFGLNTTKDRIMMRLGETYLLLAEAQFDMGNLAAAATSINVIRARAHASLISSSDVTMDFILDERARELFGEENRRATLMRTGTLLERVEKYNPQSAGSIQSNNALLPIPQQEIDLNKDATLTQNPGYQ